MTIKCLACNNENINSAKFCMNCGNNLEYEVSERFDTFISYKRKEGHGYAKNIKDKLENHGKKVFLDVDVLKSGVFTDKLFQYIKQSDFFILICTEDIFTSKKDNWINREIKCALDNKKTIIPIFVNDFSFDLNSLPKNISKIKNYQGIKYEPTYLDAMIEKILTFLDVPPSIQPSQKNSPETIQKKVSIIPVDPKRLNFIPIYYDTTAISKLSKGKYGFYPVQLRQTVEDVGRVPEPYWYWHEGSTTLWQQLTSVNSRYQLCNITKTLLERNIDRIIKNIFEACKTTQSIDFIDLGVGTPEKDHIVIDSILKCIKEKSIKEKAPRPHIDITFIPVDISFPLIEYTVRHILGVIESAHSIKIKPILGDFLRLESMGYRSILSSERPKIMTLLGNTLGNFEEKDLLRKIKPILSHNGYLLVDVEFIDGVSDEEIKEAYYNEEMYNFVYHHLEVSNAFTDLDDDEDDYKKLIKGIYSEKMEVRLTDVGNDEKPKPIWYKYGHGQEIDLTAIPNTKVIQIYYKMQNGEEILLLWSNKYKKESFTRYIKLSGFAILGEWIDDTKRYGLYLLKPATEKRS